MADHDHDQGEPTAAERAAAEHATATLRPSADRATAALRDRADSNRDRLTAALTTMATARPGYWLPRTALAELTTTTPPTAAATGHSLARVRGRVGPGPAGPVVDPPGDGVNVHDLARARGRVGPGPAGPVSASEAADRRATFGAMLAAARSAAGLSQERLARLAGVDRRHVERLEAGTRRATAVMAAVLADAIHPADGAAAVDLAGRLALLSAAPPAGQTYPGMARVIRRAVSAARAELARRRRAEGVDETRRPPLIEP